MQHRCVWGVAEWQYQLQTWGSELRAVQISIAEMVSTCILPVLCPHPPIPALVILGAGNEERKGQFQWVLGVVNLAQSPRTTGLFRLSQVHLPN